MQDFPSKPAILIIDKPRISSHFLDMTKNLKDNFNVVVLVQKEDLNLYQNINGIHLEEHIPTEFPVEELNRIADEIKSKPELIFSIEKELDLNCYEFNINYLLYRKFASKYNIRNTHEYLNSHTPELLLLTYRKLKGIIDKYNIKYCYFESIDTLDSVILSAMARKKIITQTFERGFLSLGGEFRTRLCSGKRKRSPWLNYIYKNGLFSSKSKQKAYELLQKTKQNRQISVYDLEHMKMGTIFPKYSLNQIINKLKMVALGKDSLAPAIIKQKNRLRSLKYFSHNLPEGKFITYFLQVTPESSICYQAPEYANQDNLIEQIAIRGKYGYSVVVKEHPRCFGNRPPYFYKELSFLPNVTILPPSFSNRELILKTEAVFSVTATSPGLESILSGTPVITFGHPFFDCCPNVHNVSNPKELWDLVDKLKYDEEGQINFIAALLESSYLHPPVKGFKSIVQATGLGPVLAKGLEKEIGLYEKGIIHADNVY